MFIVIIYMVKESIKIYNISNLTSGPGVLEEIKGKVIQISDEHVVAVEITDLLDYKGKIIQIGDEVTVKSHRELLFPYIKPDFATPSKKYQIKEGDNVSFYISKISDDNKYITTSDYFTLVE